MLSTHISQISDVSLVLGRISAVSPCVSQAPRLRVVPWAGCRVVLAPRTALAHLLEQQRAARWGYRAFWALRGARAGGQAA